MTDSVELVNRHLEKGQRVYGINTGFGNSANTRTQERYLLQKSLIQHLNVAVLTEADRGVEREGKFGSAQVDYESHAMPATIARAMMLIRCNWLVRGHFAVRICVVESILSLIAQGMTPVLPLRGSISASGDLMPLSYLAGVLKGNSNIYVRQKSQRDGKNTILTADKALEYAGLEPIAFGPKEGLRLVNGTAASCAATSLTIYQAHHLAALIQVMTPMCTEALLGS